MPDLQMFMLIKSSVKACNQPFLFLSTKPSNRSRHVSKATPRELCAFERDSPGKLSRRHGVSQTLRIMHASFPPQVLQNIFPGYTSRVSKPPSERSGRPRSDSATNANEDLCSTTEGGAEHNVHQQTDRGEKRDSAPTVRGGGAEAMA